MSTIEIFEPALCCNTGVCGDDVDQGLVTFSADMDWVRSQGGDIARFNLASEPLAFAEREPVKAFLQVSGSEGLPLVLVDGVTALTGRYPDRTQLAKVGRHRHRHPGRGRTGRHHHARAHRHHRRRILLLPHRHRQHQLLLKGIARNEVSRHPAPLPVLHR